MTAIARAKFLLGRVLSTTGSESLVASRILEDRLEKMGVKPEDIGVTADDLMQLGAAAAMEYIPEFLQSGLSAVDSEDYAYAKQTFRGVKDLIEHYSAHIPAEAAETWKALAEKGGSFARKGEAFKRAEGAIKRNYNDNPHMPNRYWRGDDESWAGRNSAFSALRGAGIHDVGLYGDRYNDLTALRTRRQSIMNRLPEVGEGGFAPRRESLVARLGPAAGDSYKDMRALAESLRGAHGNELYIALEELEQKVKELGLRLGTSSGADMEFPIEDMPTLKRFAALELLGEEAARPGGNSPEAWAYLRDLHANLMKRYPGTARFHSRNALDAAADEAGKILGGNVMPSFAAATVADIDSGKPQQETACRMRAYGFDPWSMGQIFNNEAVRKNFARRYGPVRGWETVAAKLAGARPSVLAAH